MAFEIRKWSLEVRVNFRLHNPGCIWNRSGLVSDLSCLMVPVAKRS